MQFYKIGLPKTFIVCNCNRRSFWPLWFKSCQCQHLSRTAPGGGVDTLGRVIARELEKILQQSVVIVNRPGAGGVIGATSVARAAPDGYTLFVGDVALVTAPSLMKNVSYNLTKDFETISPLSSAPLVLTVPISSPIKSLVELDAYGKKSASVKQQG